MVRKFSVFLFAIPICTIVGAIMGQTSEIGKDDHPPELRHFFSGIVRQIDAKTLIVSRLHETHTFLLANGDDGHWLRVPANTLHRPVEVIYTGNREPYTAVKVQVLASLPKPTPKEEKTPTYYLTGSSLGVDEDHLIVQSEPTRRVLFIIDADTMYYDLQGYIVLDPHPQAEFRRAKRVKVGYTGKREPFHAVSVEMLR
ncbi:MAG TPA: hypothetical protein VGK48_15485 [Terriglobia bacterium]